MSISGFVASQKIRKKTMNKIKRESLRKVRLQNPLDAMVKCLFVLI